MAPITLSTFSISKKINTLPIDPNDNNNQIVITTTESNKTSKNKSGILSSIHHTKTTTKTTKKKLAKKQTIKSSAKENGKEKEKEKEKEKLKNKSKGKENDDDDKKIDSNEKIQTKKDEKKRIKNLNKSAATTTTTTGDEKRKKNKIKRIKRSPTEFVENVRSLLERLTTNNNNDSITATTTNNNNDDDGPKPLNVVNIDYLIRDNCYDHWTDAFSITHTNDDEKSLDKARLVVRRGQSFRLRITFNRLIRKSDDIINLAFSLVNVNRPNYQTFIVTPVLEEHVIVGLSMSPSNDGGSAWHARLANTEGTTASIIVTPSPKSVVGEWNLHVDTKLRRPLSPILTSTSTSTSTADINRATNIESPSPSSSSSSSPIPTLSSSSSPSPSFVRYTSDKTFHLLFNPWCKHDSVYLKDRDAIRDYVLSDSGLIYRGSHSSIRPVAWIFGQYEKNVLEATMLALSTLGSLAPSDAGDPVKVARHLSNIVHTDENGHNGVVMGYWPNNGSRNAFRDGTNPYNFTGSTTILQRFYKKHRPIKYGQCWVFAGVATTMCRALGIPARPVTNYRSAHDTNQSLTVDYLFDQNKQRELVLPRRDSVWNFHVWTEVWMQRPDLSGSMYDGWQVIDATPQEQSDGNYQMGPASVEACKRGEILKHFDTKFLYSEVNSDEVEWIVHNEQPDEPIKLLAYRTDSIGVLIITKAMGTQYREDLTQRYKHQEKTREERETMLKALRLCKNNFSRYTINELFTSVKFELQLPDDVVIGETFRCLLRMRNVSRRPYTIPSTIIVATTTYTGRIVNECKRNEQTITLAPGQEELITMTLDYNDYYKCLVDQNSFIIHALASIANNELDNEYEFFKKEIFRLRMPDISIQVEGPLKERKSFKCTLTLVNPLPRALTKGVFYLEGPGLGKPIKIPVKGKIGINEQAQVSIMLTPKSSGTKLIVVKFRSKQLNDVDGFKEIKIHPLSVWSAYDRTDPLLS